MELTVQRTEAEKKAEKRLLEAWIGFMNHEITHAEYKEIEKLLFPRYEEKDILPYLRGIE